MMWLEVPEDCLKKCILQQPHLFEEIALSVDESIWTSWQERRLSMGRVPCKQEPYSEGFYSQPSKAVFTQDCQVQVKIEPTDVRNNVHGGLSLHSLFRNQAHAGNKRRKLVKPYLNSPPKRPAPVSTISAAPGAPLELVADSIDITNLSHEIPFLSLEAGELDKEREVLSEMNRMLANFSGDIGLTNNVQSTNDLQPDSDTVTEAENPVSDTRVVSKTHVHKTETHINSSRNERPADLADDQDPHIDSTAANADQENVFNPLAISPKHHSIPTSDTPEKTPLRNEDYSGINECDELETKPDVEGLTDEKADYSEVIGKHEVSDPLDDLTEEDELLEQSVHGLISTTPQAPQVSQAVIELSSDEEEGNLPNSDNKLPLAAMLQQCQSISKIEHNVLHNYRPPPQLQNHSPYPHQNYRQPTPSMSTVRAPVNKLSLVPSFSPQRTGPMLNYPRPPPGEGMNVGSVKQDYSLMSTLAGPSFRKTPKKAKASVSGSASSGSRVDGLVKCNVCNRGFTHKADLQAHMVIHTGKQGRDRARLMARKILLVKGPLVTQRQAQRSITNIPLTAVELSNIMSSLEEEGYGRVVNQQRNRTFFCKNHPDSIDVSLLEKLDIDLLRYRESFMTMSCTDLTYLELVKQFHHQSNIIFH